MSWCCTTTKRNKALICSERRRKDGKQTRLASDTPTESVFHYLLFWALPTNWPGSRLASFLFVSSLLSSPTHLRPLPDVTSPQHLHLVSCIVWCRCVKSDSHSARNLGRERIAHRDRNAACIFACACPLMVSWSPFFSHPSPFLSFSYSFPGSRSASRQAATNAIKTGFQKSYWTRSFVDPSWMRRLLVLRKKIPSSKR